MENTDMINTFNANLEKLQAHIHKNGCLPKNKKIGSEIDDETDDDEDEKGNIKNMGLWIYRVKNRYAQQSSYMNGTTHPTMRSIFEGFMEKNKEHFLSTEEEFTIMLSKIETFILNNGRLPKAHIEDERKMALWVSRQKNNYMDEKTGHLTGEKCKLYNLFQAFKKKFSEHFVQHDEKYYMMLHTLIEHICEKNDRPRLKNKGEEELSRWLDYNRSCYKESKKAYCEKDEKGKMKSAEKIEEVMLKRETFCAFQEEYAKFLK